jgi:putative ABC exporter
VTSAFFYLQFTTVKNRVVQQVKRLKQPKYLFGALVGAAYFYFFFFRKVIAASFSGASTPNIPAITSDVAPYLPFFGGLLLFVVIALSWILPSGRAALKFSEAEIAFLFPAPITRRRLIHFKLLRSQFAILISTFFLSLIFGRANYLGGNALTHAAGWWVVLSTLSLHFTAASFAREQLLSLGVHPNRRRAIAIGALVLLVIGCGWWLRGHIAAPTATAFNGPSAFVRYCGEVLQLSPIKWILAPFALVVRPYFAASLSAFALAMGPALGVMALHYWWVMRADVSFEEASMEQARKVAETTAAMRTGDWRAARNQPIKARQPAFHLGALGLAIVGFPWKSLIALGPFFRMRTWLMIVGAIAVFHVWARATGLNAKLYAGLSVFPLGIGAWLLVVGPMIMRRDVRLMVTHMDLLKSYPLRGWQVVLGSLLCPIVILAAVEWLLLLLGAPGFAASGKGAALAAGVFGTGSLGIALILPPLTGLMLSIPFAATLYFPSWIDNSGSRGGGVEVMGQRLIFFAGYIVVLLVALVPAMLCGGLTAFVVHWLGGMIPAIVATAVVASLIIGAEFAALIWWLGERFEHFDLSQEMPR